MYTGNDRFSGNDRYSGRQGPDRFFRYIRRSLYCPIPAGQVNGISHVLKGHR